MIRGRAEERSAGLTEDNMLVTGKQENSMEKEHI